MLFLVIVSFFWVLYSVFDIINVKLSFFKLERYKFFVLLYICICVCIFFRRIYCKYCFFLFRIYLLLDFWSFELEFLLIMLYYFIKEGSRINVYMI